MPTFLQQMGWLPAAPIDFSAKCKELRRSVPRPGDAIRFLAGHALDGAQSAVLSRAIKARLEAGDDLEPLTGFRLGVLANSTADLLCDCLAAAAARHGVALEVMLGPYDQVLQHGLDQSSNLNRARLDAILIAADHRWFRLEQAELSGAAETRVTAAVAQLRDIALAVSENKKTAAILQTVPCPPDPLFGGFDVRHAGTVRSMIGELNRRIVDLAAQTGSYLLDVASLAERVGTDAWFDPVQWASYKLPFRADLHPLYADVVGRLIGAIRGRSRKCLVLDLDNTLWGGVIGDDGLEGIQIGQGSATGEAFLAVQQMARELRARGVFLAVSSKNDETVARRPFRDHPDMILRESDISVFQANWLDKSNNLEAIAKALNIGLDALVLLDDNPAERAQMRAALPEVATPELPSDPSWYPRYLLAAGYFESTAFSAEDRLRVVSIETNAKRAEALAKSRDLGDYLAALEMKISFAPFDRQGRERITQLINKTNQFNLTNRRYTLDEVAAVQADANAWGLQVRLADKFGEFGMIAVVICRGSAEDVWEIDTWLMSCRVLGRGVEEAMLNEVVREATARGVRRLEGVYRPSAKNGMVSDFYSKLGFVSAGADGGGEGRFTLDISSYRAHDLPIEVKRDEALRQSAE